MSQSEQPGITGVRLAEALADLKEEEALEIVRLRMARGDDPMQIIEDCQAGMREVGERYVQQRYFLSALIMAGEILRQITDIVLPAVEARYSGPSSGRVLLGTVQGDIHDLGKNMLLMLLRSHGFSVRDLGVDVAPETFVEEARAFKPHVIGLSGLITAAYTSMQETLGALRAMMAEDGIQIPVILGGHVNEHVCQYVGADYWTTDAMEGVRLCQQLVGERRAPPRRA
ncbi:MAG: cobalamin B12-binding domain-containing protein [Anaerolineae bacterium]